MFLKIKDRNMEFAFHLLPYILQVPPRNKDRPSTAEVAAHFIQIFPVSFLFLSLIFLAE
jgi:hypothetical protein